jgi:hypothetical protein
MLPQRKAVRVSGDGYLTLSASDICGPPANNQGTSHLFLGTPVGSPLARNFDLPVTQKAQMARNQISELFLLTLLSGANLRSPLFVGRMGKH